MIKNKFFAKVTQLKTYGYLLVTLIGIYCHNTAHSGVLAWFKNCDNQCTQAKLCSDANAAAWCENNCKSKTDQNGKAYVTGCTINRVNVKPNIINNNGPTPTLLQTSKYCAAQYEWVWRLQRPVLDFITKKYNEDRNSPKMQYMASTIDSLRIYITNQTPKIKSLIDKNITAQFTIEQKNQLVTQELLSLKKQCDLIAGSVTDFAYWAQEIKPIIGYTSLPAGLSKQQIDNIFTKRMQAR